MAGYVIYNGFWNADGVPDPARRLVKAAEDRGRTLTALPNTAFATDIASAVTVSLCRTASERSCIRSGDFALFWDKDVRLARAMEACGARLFNSSDGVAVCDDKAATHLALAGADIPMPETLVAPMTYVAMDRGPREGFLRYAEERLGWPLVVKECFGSLGGQVYLAEDRAQLEALADRMAARPFLLQRYIAASRGQDKRLYVIDGQVVAAMRRRSETDFRANIGNGGRGEAYMPTAEETRLAVRSCERLRLCFAGVDLLDDEDGTPLVCEVNASAHMAALTTCTGVDVAGEMVEYVIRQEGLLW